MATEKRLIDANALVRDMHYCDELNGNEDWSTLDIEDLVEEQPTVDAVEVVHSWWEKSTEGYKVCHHCKADVAIFSSHKNYCPNCGAKMDGDGNV